MIGLEECNCSCHYPHFGKVDHIVPCCVECEFCHRKISMSYIDVHEIVCMEIYNPKINSVRLEVLLEALDTLKKAYFDVSSIEQQLVDLVSKLSKKEFNIL